MRSYFILTLAAFSIPFQAQTSSPGKSSDARQAGNPSASSLSRNAASPAIKKESWTELSLEKSGLQQSNFNAVLLGRYEESSYTRELVRVEWRQGDPIEITVVIPHGISKPAPIIYLYDYTSDGARFQNDGWCKRASQGGFAAVGFASALSGQRFHSPRPMREWFVSELQESLGTSTHDVEMVLNYLAVRGDFDMSRTGMIAQGSGGAVAILAASADPRIAALDLINPWGDWPDWLKNSAQIPSDERAQYLTPEFLARVAALDPVAYLPHLKLQALRVQQISADSVTPTAAQAKIAASVPSPADQLVRYPNAAAHQNAWQSEGLSGWIWQRLKPAVASQSPMDRSASR